MKALGKAFSYKVSMKKTREQERTVLGFSLSLKTLLYLLQEWFTNILALEYPLCQFQHSFTRFWGCCFFGVFFALSIELHTFFSVTLG